MSLSRVWIVHPKLSPTLCHKGEMARFRKAEVKVVQSIAALEEELDTGERIILLATEAIHHDAQKIFQEQILAARVLPESIPLDLLPQYIEAVLKDSFLQHELEILELNAWTGLRAGKYDDPSIEFLGKTVLEISSCRDLKGAEEVLVNACSRIAKINEVVIAHDPPHLSSRILGNYQLAVPINFDKDLLAHVYVKFASNPETSAIESVGELILNLSDIIALAVERNRILSKAEQTKLVWEASFNAVEDPLVILSENLEVVRANKAYGALLKSPAAKLVGKRVPDDFLTPNQESQERDVQFEGQWYRLYLDPIASPQGIGRSVLRLRNISAEHSLTEKIISREQVAELGVLVGSVAHEINNPIGGILALGQLMLKDLKEKDSLHADIENIVSAAERCKKIVQTMLSLVRKADDHREHFHLGESIKAATDLVSTEVQRLGLKFSKEGLDLGSDFEGNRNRIMQVCFHMLQGSLQALEDKKQGENFSAKLKILLKETTDQYELEFLDNGLVRTHEHVLKNSVSYAVAQLLLEEHGGHLKTSQSPEWNHQTITLPRTDLSIL